MIGSARFFLVWFCVDFSIPEIDERIWVTKLPELLNRNKVVYKNGPSVEMFRVYFYYNNMACRGVNLY